jgi:hypothetical protein
MHAFKKLKVKLIRTSGRLPLLSTLFKPREAYKTVYISLPTILKHITIGRLEA